MNVTTTLYSIEERKNDKNEAVFLIFDSLGFCITTDPAYFNTYEEAYDHLISLLQKKLNSILNKIHKGVGKILLQDISKEIKTQETIILEMYNQQSIFNNKPKYKVNKGPSLP
ncbi:hypothetical protein [Yersinia ruckeri]|uniref:hypothetical protein n=1 Tax=Yersinia ruckeri TaxID=29486 RepID=UPI002237EC0F|nr:hypothetical protein [Yersinia ruckeri]MCW6541751.1 hypothetical protein [Yersinia ruckeri]MCW6590133.1 hypothetical protein [Yersinia ruckeri]UZX92172.1 hypothetical protein ND439_02105 [Yersinia ruckeri]